MTCKHFSIETNGGQFSGVLTTHEGPEYLIRAGEHLIRFEWHSYCGPTPITKSGKVREFRHNHPFFRAACLWNVQGRRIEEGECIWHEPRQMIILKQVGRQIISAIDGEVGHDW